MNKVVLSPRKPDTLDQWNQLYIQRRLAYESGNVALAKELHQQLIQKRIEGGWTMEEISEEFDEYSKVLQQPFVQPTNDSNIRYDVNDENGIGRGLSLTLSQVGQYWKYRDAGFMHAQALKNSL